MEIKSSIFNSPQLKFLKDSIIWASEEDHKEEWRVKLIEYINMTADNDDDEFFYDMLAYTQFLKPDNETTAYTTPDRLIYMNAPGIIGENRKHWEFTYCHECLHQLWDTFKVADRIKSEGHEFNHFLLNVASDCVINDYLVAIRKKSIPDGLITPEYLKSEFGIEYNRKEDTQYSLYLKLLPKAKELSKDQNLQQQCGDDDQQGQGGQPGQDGQPGQGSQGSQRGQSGQGGQGNQRGQGDQGDNKSSSSDAKNAQNSANNAKGAADATQKAADEAKKNGENGADKKQDAANKAKEAAKEAQAAADAAKEAEKKGDKKAAKAASDKAKEAEKKAKEAAKEAGVDVDSNKQGNKDGKDGNNSENGGSGQGKSTGSHKEMPMTEEDIKKLASKTADVIDKYKNRISGALSDFIRKCKSSAKLENSGLAIHGTNAVKGWNQQMNSAIRSYVKAKVQKARREFEPTYTKFKKGSGFAKFGEPIKPGKRIRKENLTINPVFYIDNSYSMSSGNAIEHVWDAVYIICESLKKQFKSERVVDSITFKLFAFERSFREIEYGKRTTANGGTFDFDELLEGILERSKDNLINIIITDGQFNVKENETEKFLKELKGLVIYITNCPNESGSTKVKDISKKHPGKLVFIEATSDFKLN